MFRRRPVLKRRSGLFGGNIMRIGSLARSPGRLVALLVATTSTAILPLATFGQAQVAAYDSYGAPRNQGQRQAFYNAPADREANATASPYIDANGNPMVVPAGYCQQCGQGCDDCSGG